MDKSNLEALRAALKPFADIAGKLHHSWGEQQELTLGSEMGILTPTITIGDLRRAADAYDALASPAPVGKHES